MSADDSKINLCSECANACGFPLCLSDTVEFGDGHGGDNIIECRNFVHENTVTIK